MASDEKKEELLLEDALKALEELTGRMEKETLSLDEMLKLYKEGLKLSGQCEAMLSQAEQELEVLEQGAESTK